MSRIAPPPARTTVLDQMGNLSTKWVSWLRTLRIVGESALDLEVLQQFAEINQLPADPDVLGIFEPASPADRSGVLDDVVKLSPSSALDWSSALDDVQKLRLLAPADRNWSELRAEQDTFTNRSKFPAAAAPDGSFFRATDGRLLWQKRIVAGTPAWVYVAGILSDVLANIPTSSLGTNDAGLLFDVTDYAHVLRWTGSGWEWGPGESGSGYFADFPFAPTGGIWHLCDGSTVAYLKSDGTTANYTTKNLTGHFRKSVTSGADATVAAVAPGFSGSGGLTGNDNDAGSRAAAGAGGDPLVALNPHQHSFSGSVDATGEPAAYKVLTYFRR